MAGAAFAVPACCQVAGRRLMVTGVLLLSMRPTIGWELVLGTVLRKSFSGSTALSFLGARHVFFLGARHVHFFWEPGTEQYARDIAIRTSTAQGHFFLLQGKCKRRGKKSRGSTRGGTSAEACINQRYPHAGPPPLGNEPDEFFHSPVRDNPENRISALTGRG